MIPEEASVGLWPYSVLLRFSAIWGPLLFAFIGETTGSSRNPVLSLILSFSLGALLLSRVDLAEARASRERLALDADEATTHSLRMVGYDGSVRRAPRGQP